jgi:saccharopepsin
MQLLSSLDTKTAISQVTTIRVKTMESLPQELPPATLVKLLGGSAPDNKLAVDVASNSGDTSLTGYIDGETVKKYGLIAIVLLTANVVVGLVLLAFAVMNWVRRGSNKRGGPLSMTGIASTQYVAVGLEDDIYPPNQKRYGD